MWYIHTLQISNDEILGHGCGKRLILLFTIKGAVSIANLFSLKILWQPKLRKTFSQNTLTEDLLEKRQNQKEIKISQEEG